MKVVVTGANGYIGRHVLEQLQSIDCEIVALDGRFDERKEKISYCVKDIFNDDLTEVFSGADVCIHLAYRDGFRHMSENHILDLPNHVQFIEKAIHAGIHHFVLMGTMHEVGYWEGMIDESTPCNPINYYGIAKNAFRQISKILCDQNQCTWQWLRAYYITGDDTRSSSVFGKLALAVKERKKTFPLNSGKILYDFIDVDELAKQIVAVALQSKITGIINCCSGTPVSLLDKITEQIQQKQYNIELELGAFPDRPYDSPGIWGDATKIKTIMQGDPHVE